VERFLSYHEATKGQDQGHGGLFVTFVSSLRAFVVKQAPSSNHQALPTPSFGKTLRVSPRMRAIRIEPRVKRSGERSEARSGTLGNLQTSIEPAERVTEAVALPGRPSVGASADASSAHAVGLRLSCC